MQKLIMIILSWLFPTFTPPQIPPSPPKIEVAASPVVVAAGDIACPTCKHQQTAELIANINPQAVLTLGDLQYETGSLTDFKRDYDPTWGKFKAITYPSPGNHEYGTLNAKGYFDYFKVKPYYSFDIGKWHLISLNSNCYTVGGCHKDSAQEKWLRQDLVSHSNKCTLAYWHHPRFSSGQHDSDPTYKDFWQALVDYKADVVLVGHDHDYERFAPINGLREFVVGTGGRSLYAIKNVLSDSEVRNDQTYGVLKMTLHPDRYDWQFVPIPGQTFTDSGSSECN